MHPDIVAAYDYIFIWDEDLGVEHFNWDAYFSSSFFASEIWRYIPTYMLPVVECIHYLVLYFFCLL